MGCAMSQEDSSPEKRRGRQREENYKRHYQDEQSVIKKERTPDRSNARTPSKSPGSSEQPFRRSNFDRNSQLRHSKKRLNSTKYGQSPNNKSPRKNSSVSAENKKPVQNMVNNHLHEDSDLKDKSTNNVTTVNSIVSDVNDVSISTNSFGVTVIRQRGYQDPRQQPLYVEETPTMPEHERSGMSDHASLVSEHLRSRSHLIDTSPTRNYERSPATQTYETSPSRSMVSPRNITLETSARRYESSATRYETSTTRVDTSRVIDVDTPVSSSKSDPPQEDEDCGRLI